MKYALEIGSGAMIHIPSFIKIGSGIENLVRGDSQIYMEITQVYFRKVG
jgi:hypothetical protein